MRRSRLRLFVGFALVGGALYWAMPAPVRAQATSGYESPAPAQAGQAGEGSDQAPPDGQAQDQAAPQEAPPDALPDAPLPDQQLPDPNLPDPTLPDQSIPSGNPDL
jgi:hypothetical protein